MGRHRDGPQQQKENQVQINVNKYYPEKYIKAEHLDGPCRVKVESVREEELTSPEGKAEDKIIVRFSDPVCEHGPRELVLNKGRLQALIEAMGTNDTDRWLGRAVTIYPDKVRAFGKWVDTVLVKPKAPSPHELVDDDIPY